MMPGVSFEEITSNITDAYIQSELETILRSRMNVRLDRVVNPGNFDYVVFQLRGWAERNGREVELVRIAAQAKPGHAGMQSIYQKYGMGVPVFLQQSGTALLPGPQSITSGGFEVHVKKY